MLNKHVEIAEQTAGDLELEHLCLQVATGVAAPWAPVRTSSNSASPCPGRRSCHSTGSFQKLFEALKQLNASYLRYSSLLISFLRPPLVAQVRQLVMPRPRAIRLAWPREPEELLELLPELPQLSGQAPAAFRLELRSELLELHQVLVQQALLPVKDKENEEEKRMKELGQGAQRASSPLISAPWASPLAPRRLSGVSGEPPVDLSSNTRSA